MSIRRGLYNKDFAMASVSEEIPTNVTIRNHKTCLTLKYGLMRFNGHDYQDTFVLEIDTGNPQRGHSRTLPLEGFGQMLHIDYAEAATKIAKEFCAERGWTVNNELNHWPVLQFIVSRPGNVEAKAS